MAEEIAIVAFAQTPSYRKYNDSEASLIMGLTNQILEELVARHGWQELGERIRIRCFQIDPSIQSSLKFLRKTDWARAKVEKLYLDDSKRTRRGS